MNTVTVLLVLFVLDGEAHTFAVQADSPAECAVMQAKTPEVLKRLTGKTPQFFAASCAEVKPIVTDV